MSDQLDPNSPDGLLTLGWELYHAQPTHPKIAELAAQALAIQPERSNASRLLALHLTECGRTDEAARLFEQVVARQDGQSLHAMRERRDLATEIADHTGAIWWAEAVLRETQESYSDWLDLGAALAMDGQVARGWQLLDEAVAMCARTDPDELGEAHSRRAFALLISYAPPARYAEAAREAMAREAADPLVLLGLGWAYLLQYEFDQAEQVALQMLRQDPTDEQALALVKSARRLQQVIADAEAKGYTLAEAKAAGGIEVAWRQLRDQITGTSLPVALAALEAVMPDELTATLLPGATSEVADEALSWAGPELLVWHNGQRPGTGAAWGLAEPFRMMSATEILAWEELVEANPDDHPGWPIREVSEAVFTNDADAHLALVSRGVVVLRREGEPDQVVADSLTDWVWDRVVDFGGHDPRPGRARSEQDSLALKG